MVAEPRDVDADLLGGTDHQRALRHADLHAVDRQRDELDGSRGGRRLDGHMEALQALLMLVVCCGPRGNAAGDADGEVD